MLLGKFDKSKGEGPNFEVSNIVGTATGGSAHWECKYQSPVNPSRMVHNKVDANFTIANGKITKHVDTFDWWSWAKQAMGCIGFLCGCCSCFHNIAKKKANSKLQHYMSKKNN